MKKNIEALWMGRPIAPSISEEDRKAFSEKSKRAGNAYDVLEKHLNSEQLRLLHEYLSLQSAVNDIERKNAFVYGFSLGVKLIAEGLEE